MSSSLKKILAAKLITNPLGNRFIQLMHPGGQPKISRARASYCPPNTGKVHTRKFLSSTSEYLDNHGQVQHGQLNFWGEWELGSHVWRINHNPVSPGMPIYVHTPDCFQNALYSTIKNKKTDNHDSIVSNGKSCNSAINSCCHQ